MYIDIVNKSGLPLPERGSLKAAGWDLMASEDTRLLPKYPTLVPTGLYVAIQDGYEMQIRPRSGLSTRNIIVANSPGTIDSDYRGEIKILMTNLSEFGVDIKRGDRIAQAVLAKVEEVVWLEQKELPETIRGSRGFGSTGD